MEWNAIQCVSFPIGKRLLAKNRFHMVFAMHIAHVFGKGRIFCRVAHLFGKKNLRNGDIADFSKDTNSNQIQTIAG